MAMIRLNNLRSSSDFTEHASEYAVCKDAAVATLRASKRFNGFDKYRGFIDGCYDEFTSRLGMMAGRNWGASDGPKTMLQVRRAGVGEAGINAVLAAAQEDYDMLYSDEEKRSSLRGMVWPWPFHDASEASPLRPGFLETDINNLSKEQKMVVAKGVDDLAAQAFNDKLFVRWRQNEAIVFLSETALMHQTLAASLAARNLVPDSHKVFDFMKDKALLSDLFNVEGSAVFYNSKRLGALAAIGAGVEKTTRNAPRDKKEIGANIARTIFGLTDQHRTLYGQLDDLADLVV